MSYISNNSPRRMIWFSQKAPKNKMDLWLSYNLHYEDPDADDTDTTDDDDTTVDNSNQRTCDLIMKAWDCGKWVPIVGFNTTAANKMNIVSGETYEYTITSSNGNSLAAGDYTSEGYEGFHLPLFRDDDASPYELFDAGTLGTALTNFVKESEWETIIASGLGTAITNSMGDIIDVQRAQSDDLGGIWADNFGLSSYAATDRYVPCKFLTATEGYNDNLYVDGNDIITALNTVISSSNTLDIQLATETEIGGIHAQTDTTDQDYRGLPVVFGGPNAGLTYGGNVPSGFTLYGDSTTYNSDNSFLYIPGWALADWMESPLVSSSSTQEPFVHGWLGIDTQLRSGYTGVWVGMSGVSAENAGLFCKQNEDGDGVEWVGLVAGDNITISTSGSTMTISASGGTTYEELDSNNTSNYLYVVRGNDSNQKQMYTLGGNGGWTKTGDGLSVVYDSSNLEYKKKADIYGQSDITIDSLSNSTITFTTSETNNSEQMWVSYESDNTVTGFGISEYQYKKITLGTKSTLAFSNISTTEYMNPVYMKLIVDDTATLSFTNTKCIFNYYEQPASSTIPTSLNASTEWLVTVQFGVVKFDQIISSSSV